MKLPDLTSQEKVALAFINKFSPYGGITTGRLQKELEVATPTIYKVINRLVELKEVEKGERQGLWTVTETKKLF
jgi:Mn-dependent DtxR family transcriptional regulator